MVNDLSVSACEITSKKTQKLSVDLHLNAVLMLDSVMDVDQLTIHTL